MKPGRILLFAGLLALVPILVAADLQAEGTNGSAAGNAAIESPGPAPSDPAPPTTAIPPVSSRTSLMNGQQVGAVLINNQLVMTVNYPAGGFSPGQRADIIASRLSTQLSRGYTARDIHVERSAAGPMLMMGGQLLVTAEPQQKPHGQHRGNV